MGLTRTLSGGMTSGLSGGGGSPLSIAPVVPVGALSAFYFAPPYTASDASHLVPCVAGDGIRWVQDIVSGTWYEQATAAQQATQRGSWYGEFDGTADWYSLTGLGATLPLGFAPRTIGISFRLLSVGRLHGLFSYGFANVTNGVYIGVFNTDNKPLISQNGDSVATTGMSAYTTGVWYDLIVTVGAASLWTVYQEGTATGSKTMTTLTVDTTPPRIARLIGSGEYGHVDISKVFVDDTALSGAGLSAFRASLIAGR